MGGSSLIDSEREGVHAGKKPNLCDFYTTKEVGR